MTIPTESMAVVSTAHVPEGESLIIGTMLADGDLLGFARPEGWFLRARLPGTGNGDNPGADAPALSFVLGYMAGRGFDWVLFDRDADAVDALPTFDW